MKLPKMNRRFLFFFVCTSELLHYVPSLLATPIINGIRVNPDKREYTYHVSIHHKAKGLSDFQYICGGTIIGERHILTAAHCYMKKARNRVDSSVKPKRTKIIAGTHQRNGPGVDVAIITVYIPIEFNTVDNKFTGDIAVLRLAVDLGVTEHPTSMKIMPLLPLLPTAERDQYATFCGFGQEVYDTHTFRGPPRFYSDINRYLNVMMLGKVQCPMYKTTICAINSDTTERSPCDGDAGGALIYRDHIIGVLSAEPLRCRDSTGPALFTRISAFTDFIDRAKNDLVDNSVMHVLGEVPSSHSSFRQQLKNLTGHSFSTVRNFV